MISERQRKKRSNKTRGSNGPRRGNDEGVPTRPPMLTDQLSVGQTLRFVTTSVFSGAQAVTYQNLLDAWFVAGTTTTAYQLFDFVKIKRVTLRAMYNGALSVTTVGIEFPDISLGISGSGKQVTNTNLGTVEPAYVSVRPSKDSQAGKYQSSQSQTAFIFRAVDVNANAVQGVIIDVELSFKNSADVNPAALQNAVTGAQAGILYFGGLDGARAAGTTARSVFVPRL